ncbi:hypothetical protein BJY52DRAFT_1227974 [Lactarius psammicola]|nr:hypothetical protein BJY52DRAFT_1227974 [Lactarius psammicola]
MNDCTAFGVLPSHWPASHGLSSALTVQKYERTMASRCEDLAALDLADARVVIVLDEPVDGLLEALLEWRELELFVVLATSHSYFSWLALRVTVGVLGEGGASRPIRQSRSSACHHQQGRDSRTRMTADLEFARKAERLEDLLSDLAGAHVLEASAQRGLSVTQSWRGESEVREVERAECRARRELLKVVPKVVLRRRDTFGLSNGKEVDNLDYGSLRREGVLGLQTGETSPPSVPISNHATDVSSRSRSGSKERERGQPVVETGYGSEVGSEHEKSDLSGEISNGDDDGMRNDATTRRDWLAKPKIQVGVKKQANCRGSNGKDNWFDVVVLEQLLYEHLCEVVRVPRQTQRLTRARDDKRRTLDVRQERSGKVAAYHILVLVVRILAGQYRSISINGRSTYEVNIELCIESREKNQSRGHGPVGNDCQNRKTRDGPVSDVTGRSLLGQPHRVHLTACITGLCIESLPTLIKPVRVKTIALFMTPPNNPRRCQSDFYTLLDASERGSQWLWLLELSLPGGVITKRGVEGLHSNLNHRLPLVHSNSDQGVFCEGPSAGMGDSPPPLGVKLTCYRLLNVTTALLWIIPKAFLSYKNRSIAATTVDLLAALFGVV